MIRRSAIEMVGGDVAIADLQPGQGGWLDGRSGRAFVLPWPAKEGKWAIQADTVVAPRSALSNSLGRWIRGWQHWNYPNILVWRDQQGDICMALEGLNSRTDLQKHRTALGTHRELLEYGLFTPPKFGPVQDRSVALPDPGWLEIATILQSPREKMARIPDPSRCTPLYSHKRLQPTVGGLV